MAAIDHALHALTGLIAALEALGDVLRHGHARVYRVPLYSDLGAKQVCIDRRSSGDLFDDYPEIPLDAPLTRLWDIPIPVRTISAPADAMHRAISAIQGIHRRPGQAPERADRLPGLVYLPRNKELARLVRAANKAKDDFKRALEALGTPKQRRPLLLETDLRHVLLLQAYRKITLIRGDVDVVSFSWSGASRMVYKVPRHALLERLEALKASPDMSDWERRVTRLADREFARVRREAPFPIANLKINGEWCRRETAPIPLIFSGPTRPEIRDLHTYQPGTEPGDRRGDQQLLEEPLIEELGIYRYRKYAS